MLVYPTGGGKTVIAVEVVRAGLAHGLRGLFIAHRQELVDQCVAKLARAGIEAGVIMGARARTPDAAMQVASIQTLARRDYVPADFVIVDECHHAVSTLFERVLIHYRDAYLLGLTATAERLDGRGLGRIHGAIVQPTTVRELCDLGVVIEPEVWAGAARTPELEGIGVARGDFMQNQLAERMRDTKLVGRVVDHWFEHAAGLRSVAFCVNRAHSRDLVDRFLARGVPAEHVDFQTPDRDAVFERLRAGETLVVSNVELVTEGWDLPTLECAIVARPTKSHGLHRQIIGRVMRPAEGKRAIVLDHAGNSLRHGLVTDPVDYSLEGRLHRAVYAIRTCPECYRVLRAGAPCPCGYVPEPKELAGQIPTETAERLARLEAAKPKPPVKHRPAKPEHLDAYRAMIAEAVRGRYKIGWARMRFKAKFGIWPNGRVRAAEADYVCPAHTIDTETKRCNYCGGKE